jgi:hypothetical protein
MSSPTRVAGQDAAVTTRQPVNGPSHGLRAWWRLTIESVVCLVLIGAAVLLWVRAPDGWLNGAATALLVSLVLRIIWHPT